MLISFSALAGVLIGALISAFFSGKLKSEPKKDTDKGKEYADKHNDDDEKLQKQWQNLMNYNGMRGKSDEQ